MSSVATTRAMDLHEHEASATGELEPDLLVFKNTGDEDHLETLPITGNPADPPTDSSSKKIYISTLRWQINVKKGNLDQIAEKYKELATSCRTPSLQPSYPIRFGKPSKTLQSRLLAPESSTSDMTSFLLP